MPEAAIPHQPQGIVSRMRSQAAKTVAVSFMTSGCCSSVISRSLRMPGTLHDPEARRFDANHATRNALVLHREGNVALSDLVAGHRAHGPAQLVLSGR